MCGKCCTAASKIALTPYGLWRIENKLGLSSRQIAYIGTMDCAKVIKYIQLRVKVNNEGKCIFLSPKNNLCSINEFKPLACRIFPFSPNIPQTGYLEWVPAISDFVEQNCGALLNTPVYDMKYYFEKYVEIKTCIEIYQKEIEEYLNLSQKWLNANGENIDVNTIFDFLDEQKKNYIIEDNPLTKEKSDQLMNNQEHKANFYRQLKKFHTLSGNY